MSEGDDALQGQSGVCDGVLLSPLILAPSLSLHSTTSEGFFKPKHHRHQSLTSLLQGLYTFSFASMASALVGTLLTGP